MEGKQLHFTAYPMLNYEGDGSRLYIAFKLKLMDPLVYSYVDAEGNRQQDVHEWSEFNHVTVLYLTLGLHSPSCPIMWREFEHSYMTN